MIAIEATSDKVDAFTLSLKKDKVKFDSTSDVPNKSVSNGTTLAAAAYDQTNKIDAYLVEKDSDSSVDLNDDTNTNAYESYDIDVDGNVWVVTDGKIYEYKAGGDMTKVYTCDSSLDSISVYDANSLVTWSNNGDVLYNC